MVIMYLSCIYRVFIVYLSCYRGYRCGLWPRQAHSNEALGLYTCHDDGRRRAALRALQIPSKFLDRIDS